MTKNGMQIRSIRVLSLALLTVFFLDARADNTPREEGAAAQPDHRAAIAYFQDLIKQGDPVGHYYLASMHAEGKGVVKNPKKAAQHYELAANKGYVPAQYTMGMAYATGTGGTPKDYAMAAKWWERAARQGHADSQYELARLYHDGLGVRQNPQEAMKWHRKAAQQGHPEALKIVAALDTSRLQIDAAPVAAPAQDTTSGEAIAKNETSTAPVATPKPTAATTPEHKTDKTKQGDNETAIAQIDQALLDAPNTAVGVNGESWIMSQPSGNYAVQIFFERSEDKVLDFMRQLGPAGNSAYFHTRHNGEDYIAVVHGSYPTYSQARGALEELPASIQKHLPWVREYKDIKSTLAIKEFSKPAAEGGLASAP